MRKVSPFLLAVCSLCVAVNARAQLPYQKQSLRELEPVSVEIQRFDEETSRTGLTARQLQTDIELRLRKSGIRVTSSGTDGELSYPMVYLRVNVSEASSKMYVFNLSVELLMLADITFDKPRPSNGRIPIVFAATWRATGYGLTSKDEAGREIRSRIADYTDEFTNDYLAVNPKR